MNKTATPIKPNSQKQALVWNDKLGINEYTQRRMPFGKYVNVMISDIPTDYIKWGVLNLNPMWAEYFGRELQRRDKSFKTPPK